MEESTVAHIAEGSDGDEYTLCLVLDGALGERIQLSGGGHGWPEKDKVSVCIGEKVKREGERRGEERRGGKREEIERDGWMAFLWACQPWPALPSTFTCQIRVQIGLF